MADKNGFSSFDNFENSSNVDLNSYSAANMKNNSSKKSPKGPRSPKAVKSRIGKIILSVFLVCVITGCMVAGALMVYAFGFVDATMDEDLNDLALHFTTTIFVPDGNGDFVEYQRLHGEYNRIWVSDINGNIPDNLKHAFIAIEDKRFKTHEGVDWKRTISAFANLFFKFYSSNQGGSTITQQLVKNLTGDNDTSPARKIREIMRARYLETNFSKDVILECYLNTVSMAGGMYGVEVASNYYFDKSTKDLTLSECAALAAIVKAPESYRPDKKAENNKNRRQAVLTEMYKQGYISKEEYDASYNEEITVVANKQNLNEIEINSYFVDMLIEDVVEGIMEVYGYDKTHASTNFYNGGYKIYATLNPDVQKSLENVFYDQQYAHIGKDGQQLQGSMVVMDYEGHIVGMVGGIGEKKGNLVLNRATDAVRQPGSSMKPLSAYALAVEKNLITYSTLVNDTKVMYGKNQDWTPNNWYTTGYRGHITVEKALEISCNTIPTMLVDKLGLQTSYDFVTQKFFLTDLNVYDANYSPLGMGGTNGGVTTLQEAAAYAAFGNGGVYYEPTTYYKVCDQDGKVILETESKATVAISDDTATVMNHLLRHVVEGGEGTGKDARNAANGMPIFAKTGTSNEDMNCWFTGGTPYYVASAWAGYDTLQTVSDKHVAKKMWIRVMTDIHKNLEQRDFTDSTYATSKRYCTSSGLLATSNCPNTDVGWYKISNLPGSCTVHPGVTVETETQE